MERLKKTIAFPGRFFIPSPVTARESNPWRPPWRGAALRRPRKAVQSVQHAVDTASTSPSTVPNVG